MDDQFCPRCKTTKYRNPSLKLMVNVCGHALCENCVELLFVRGSGACPECGVALRRANFRIQIFEDSAVEKEVDIRKKVLKDFNKKEENFATLREFNDYLEMVETIIFNLSNNIDVEETRRQIEQYKKDNQDAIKKNRSKITQDEEYLEMLIEEEQQQHLFHKQVIQQEEQEAKKQKVKNKEALIQDLMFSDLPATHIIATHQREIAESEVINKTKPATAFSSGIRMGRQDRFGVIAKAVEGEIFSYKPVTLEILGPDIPGEEQIQEIGYMKHIRAASDSELGGGFLSTFACQRAIQDAFAGLYFSSLSLDTVTNKGRQSMDCS